MKPSTMKSIVIGLCLFLGASIVGAQTVTVGPTGTYATPCAAFPHLTSGETVQVDANGGTPYYDTSDCLETAPSVTIVGVNGRPIIDGSKAGIAKAMWLIDGHDVVVNNFEFRNINSSGSSSNAEAIRIEPGASATPNGGNVTIEHCYIHDNFEGILSDSVTTGYSAWNSSSPYITFQYDEFANNGFGDGETHNMYLGANGNMDFTLQYSWSHDAYIGHTVKDRGPINNILYNMIGDGVGNTSYILDFPLGGSTYIVGNSLYKVPSCSDCNQAMVDWRDENDEGTSDPGYAVPNQDMHFINNTVVNDPSNTFPPAIVSAECFNASSDTCPTPEYGPTLTTPGVFENNVILGPQTEVSNQPEAFVENNILEANTPSNLAAMNFNNAAAFDYRLTAGSPAIGAGVYPPTDNTGAADPQALAAYQYVNPVNMTTRPTPTGSTMDAGAFAYTGAITSPNLNLTYTETVQAPSTGTITVTGLPTPPAGQYNYASFFSTNQAAIPDIESVASTTGTVTTTFQAYSVAATTVVPIYIYVDGTVLTANVTITPGPTALASVTLDSVYYPLTTVHLLGPGTSPVVITLSSSNPTILYAPATVTIPAGQISAETGTLNGGLNPPAMSQSAPVTLTATYNGKSVYLTTPIESPGIHNFYCGVCTVAGGTPVGVGLIFAGYTPYGGANVTATSSNTAAIPNQSFPIAQGINEGNININTNAVTTNTNVTVTLGFNGQTSPLAITLTPGGPAPASIAAVSGSGQSAVAGSPFTSPLVVLVNDANGHAVTGATVTFTGSNVSFPSGATAVTNSSGQAQVTAQPTAAGSVMVSASVSGVSTPATFTDTGTADTPASIAAVSGSGQSAAVGTSFASPLVVLVNDANSHPVAGVTVSFAGTDVSFPGGATAVTNSSGMAQVTAQPTTTGALSITASAAGVSTPASFSETGTGGPASIAAVSGSGQSAGVGSAFANPLVVLVENSSGTAVSGATVTFAGSKASFPSGNTAVTNSSGMAQVTAEPTATGTIAITASVTGVSTPASFSETGTAAATLKSITQDGSGPGSTVHLSSAAPAGGLVVSLSSSNPSVVTAPAAVTVPAGATSVETGTLLGSLWTPADSAKTATLTATANGVTKTLTATYYSPSLHSFTCQPSSCPAVVGGTTYNFAVELSGTVPVGGGTVQITSSNPAVIPNQTVSIAAGQNSPATNPVIQTNVVTTTATVTVTATFNGASISAGPITVNPAVELKSVTSDGASSPGTSVNLTGPAPTGGVVIQITSSSQTTAYAPASVTVPAGQSSVEIGTINGSLWTPAGTAESATISAAYNSVTKSVTKSFYSPGIGTFGCTETPCPTVQGGQPISFELALSKTGAPVGGATVQITSDNPSVVPNQTVVVAAGQTSPAIDPVQINTNTVTNNTAVHVTASYNGSSKVAAGGTITVTPPLPPASIAAVSGSGQSATVGSPFPNPLVVMVEDANSHAVNNATVTFAGANVSFPSGATATTNSSGQAQVTAQPTASGSLTITASVTGVSTAASFTETGNAPVALSSITQDNNYQSGTTVHLTAPAPTGGAVITLTTSNSSILYTPATVTVPAGQTSAETGTLLGSLWGQTPTSKVATLTAVYEGVTKTLTMNVDYTTLHGFYPDGSVVGGQPLGFYMETAFNVAPYGGAPYTVSSDQPAIIPTQSFTLAAGQGNDFGRSLATNPVSTTTTVNVTINYNGATETLPVTVTP